MALIGILRETKNAFERRSALTPAAVGRLVAAGHEIRLQPSQLRIFPDDEYRAAGAVVTEDLSGCEFVFGVKEIPHETIVPGAVHVFFSHTVKGQSYNMPMLRAFLEKKSAILDYELLTDERRRRLVFFGQFAGLAGTVDSLHFLGRKLASRGMVTPLADLKPALGYESLEAAKNHIRQIGMRLVSEPFPGELGPLTILVTGYGNVGKGCVEILDYLPIVYVEPNDLPGLLEHFRGDRIYVSILREEHLVRRRDYGGFDLQEYFTQPERYESISDPWIRFAHLFLNAIYWTPACPVFLSKACVAELWRQGIERPLVVGDITCDIEGSVEFTVKATDPGDPVFRWLPEEGRMLDGDGPEGITVLAVDTLPCEFPRDASEFFCRQLETIIERILCLRPDDLASTEDAMIRRALICHGGELGEDFRYLAEKIR